MFIVRLSETGKRSLLNLATGLVLVLASLFLLNSWFQAPPQTQLDLFQTNLTLQAARTLDHVEYQPLTQVLLGSDVVKAATSRYQQASQRLQARLKKIQELEQKQPEKTDYDLTRYQADLDALQLRLGILLAYQDQNQAARTAWESVQSGSFVTVAAVLAGLWDTPIRILPDAELEIRTALDGWFEATAMQHLLTLQQRVDALNAWNQEQEQLAISSLARLAVVGGLPIVGCLLGIVILLFWGAWILWRKKPAVGRVWVIPWSWQPVQAVLTIWFLAFLILGQVVPPLYVTLLGVAPQQMTYWQQAVELLLTYNSGAIVGLGLIYALCRQHYPLARDLFKVRWFDNWLVWAIGGYWVALPLVIVAGALSQLLLPESGGGNPILPLILESQGWGARVIFLVVVSLCAPIFEETLFRGLLLTSLTRYLSVWVSIFLSAFIFAVAHLNFADLLPLTTLGVVLGVVYSRSRNLLAPMLLHALWNAGSFVALVILSGR